MTYIYCKKVITNAVYTIQQQKDVMQEKLNVFLLNKRINQPEYNELTSMLTAKEIVA